MSSWYILNALGFYPVHPGSGYYDLGIPLHPCAKIRLNNQDLQIVGENWSPENTYVKRVTLNGQPIENRKISYQQIMAGGTLVFEMTHHEF